MQNLNKNLANKSVKPSELSSKIVYIDFKDEFNFLDDTYLCKFQYFPHGQFLLPYIFNFTFNFTCSCTLYWLFEDVLNYDYFYSFRNNRFLPKKILTCLSSKSELKLKKCNFTAKFLNCSKKVTSTISITPYKLENEITDVNSIFATNVTSYENKSKINMLVASTMKLKINEPEKTRIWMPMIFSILLALLILLISVFIYILVKKPKDLSNEVNNIM